MPSLSVVLDAPASEHTLWPRASDRFTVNHTQEITLIVAACYIVVIPILWHVPVLNKILYPFKLLTVGFHEMSHAVTGVLTCAHIHSVELDPDEGGATRMSGGIPWITLPAGYLGSSLVGAALISCGFNESASKIASLALAGFFVFTLWWARRSWVAWFTIAIMSGLIVLFWFVAGGVALRYFVLFIGVMSDLYVLWDIIDDTIEHKANGSDASAFAEICGCFPSQVWGVIWLLQALIMFGVGLLVGIVAFKQSVEEQKQQSKHFLPVPGTNAASTHGVPVLLATLLTTIVTLVLSALS